MGVSGKADGQADSSHAYMAIRYACACASDRMMGLIGRVSLVFLFCSAHLRGTVLVLIVWNGRKAYLLVPAFAGYRHLSPFISPHHSTTKIHGRPWLLPGSQQTRQVGSPVKAVPLFFGRKRRLARKKKLKNSSFHVQNCILIF